MNIWGLHLDSGHVALIVTNLTAIGLAFARHMPAPSPNSILYAWIYDSIQDLMKNNDRIGLRRVGARQVDPATHEDKPTN